MDYIVGMDASNVADLKRWPLGNTQDKIYQFMDKSVPDPRYTNDFDENLLAGSSRLSAGWNVWMDKMDKLKEFYNRYQHYLTRTNFEIAAVTLIVLSAILVLLLIFQIKGLLLDKGLLSMMAVWFMERWMVKAL